MYQQKDKKVCFISIKLLVILKQQITTYQLSWLIHLTLNTIVYEINQSKILYLQQNPLNTHLGIEKYIESYM